MKHLTPKQRLATAIRQMHAAQDALVEADCEFRVASDQNDGLRPFEHRIDTLRRLHSTMIEVALDIEIDLAKLSVPCTRKAEVSGNKGAVGGKTT